MLPYHDQPMTGLKGKRVLVTGAASGIGAATCTRLAAEGCHVAGMDRQADALAAKMRELRAVSYTHLTLPTICSV